jgi:putative membrane protein
MEAAMMRDGDIWSGWGFWHTPFFGGPFLLLVVLVLVFWLAMRGRASNAPAPDGNSPRQIAERRYAAGEITREQFEQLKRDLAF